METLLGYPVRTSVVHPGDKIDGRYHILSVIADGGMGTVFLAEHVLIKRRVALKVLHPELAGDLAMIRRFMNEATAAGSLGHPNIVECTDMGFTSTRVPYIVFEYLEGVLLTEEVYRVRGMTPRRTLRIAKQIASALEASHGAGIVHLDLKSDNIFLVDRDGAADHVKVLDFGIAKFMEADPDNTQRNLVIGTPEFMSPEQITNPASVDGRADVWALGVVMYEMLTARRPFNMTEGARLLLHRIVHELPPAMARKTIPAELETMILEKMLAKDPAQRFSSIAECRQAIEALLRTLESGGDSIAPPQPQPSPESSWPDEEIFITSLEPPATALAPAPAPRPPRASDGLRHPPAPQRRWPTGLLALALVAGAGGGGLLYAEQRIVSSIDDSAVKSLEATAAQISIALDASLRSAKTRASTMATSSVLRTPMETDAKAVLGVIRDERLLVPGSGDTIELSLTRDGNSPRVIRVPEVAESLGALPEQARLDVTRNGLRLIATAPIVRANGELGGAVAVASAVDLGPVRGRLSVDALGATLTGLDKPLELLPRQEPGIDAVELVVPVTVPAELGVATLSLRAMVRSTTRGGTLRNARYGAWGISGFLLFGFLGIGALRGASKKQRLV